MRRSFFIVSLVVLLTGCFEIEQSINLKQDLSGTADFHLGIDMEPMVVVMAQFAKEMEGKKGPLTADELAKAKAEFKKSATSKKSGAPEKAELDRAEINKGLPEGVKLLDFKATDREFGIATDFKFGFERVNQLINVKLPGKEGGDPTQANVIDSPFEGLEVIEKGNTITVQTKPQNPTESVKEQAAEAPKLDAETEKMVKDAFGKMRVVYRITAPFAVVSHNADRREGNTLIWEYNLEKFEKLEKSKNLDDAGVKVVYRR
ncbi:MAG TPA: hypothetical protein VG106_01810 [Vicinamibacterales bacterium]|nr:hypothetical protein [Vicinamibacterales bacterium]